MSGFCAARKLPFKSHCTFFTYRKRKKKRTAPRTNSVVFPSQQRLQSQAQSRTVTDEHRPGLVDCCTDENRSLHMDIHPLCFEPVCPCLRMRTFLTMPFFSFFLNLPQPQIQTNPRGIIAQGN